MLAKVMEDPIAAAVISAILGLGLAAIFRSVCKDGSCVVVKGPSVKSVDGTYYKIEESCYKYTPYVVDCKTAKHAIDAE
jgi:hypothetical protein